MLGKVQTRPKRSLIFWAITLTVLFISGLLLMAGFYLIFGLIRAYAVLSAGSFEYLLDAQSIIGFLISFGAILSCVIAMMSLIQRRYKRARRLLVLTFVLVVISYFVVSGSELWADLRDVGVGRQLLQLLPAFVTASILIGYSQKYQLEESQQPELTIAR